ncbi:MAG: putative baseplate assembly protein [Clostridia bacterium]|nr:putative baseplate assembly protein [Clostridia bacterium]
MLPLPNLTSKNFQTLFEEAKNRIPALTKEWTDFNYHDTGITLLQLFAWLFEMQHYYADAIGEEHQHKYLKLLGYTPLGQQPAAALITLKGIQEEMILPKGIRFMAEDTIFETEEAIKVIPNRIASVLRGNQYLDVTEIITAYDASYETVWEPSGGNCFYIGFENKLIEKQVLPLYVNIYKGKAVRIPLMQSALQLATCRWEFYTHSGWQEITEVIDETSAFLQDGYIILQLPSESSQTVLSKDYGPLHYIRCILVENNYDILPKLSYIAINAFRIKQKQTLASSFFIDCTGEDSQCYTLPHFLAFTGEIMAAVKAGDRWEIWENTSENPSFYIDRKNLWEVQIQFDKNRYGKVPDKGQSSLYIICYDKSFYTKRFIGNIAGCASQRITIDENELYQEDLSVAIYLDYKDGGQISLCRKVESLHLHADKDCVYEMNSNNIVSLGEGIYRSIPKSIKGSMMITDFSLTKGRAGNVKGKKINRIASELAPFLSDIQIFNIKNAEGGRDKETTEEAINTFRKQFAKAQRAITCEDYEKIVKQTPGLMIHKIKGISETKLSLDTSCSNKLSIIVKPFSEEQRPILSQVYKQAIKKHIEYYRLLTTEVDIQSPIYLGIDVYGCIYIRKGYDETNVYTTIKNAVDSVGEYRDFGEPIIFGTLFGQIETLESIAYVDNLSLEPIGYGGEKNLGGDIIIKPNVLTYLRNYHVELR